MIRRTLQLLLACCAALTMSAPGQAAGAASIRTLYHFGGRGDARLDAANPYAGLVRDEAGNLYGTSYGGGAAGAGGVFLLAPQAGGVWLETLIHSFSAAGAADGGHPLGGLILGPGGVLFGTTSTGGGPGNAGAGTVFALRPPGFPGAAWTETVLTVFPGGAGAGGAPAAHLLLDAGGALYGTTTMAGGAGSVFRLAPPPPGQPNWVRTDLHLFGGAGDGQSPLSALTADAGGALYGTTQDNADRQDGAGTVYRLTPPRGGNAAWSETVLFSFPASQLLGGAPNGDLLIDNSGTLYGTASAGGAKGAGAVFRLSPEAPGQPWRYTILHNFTEHFGDGGPQGGVVFGRGGSLIGTTANAAKHQQGTVFRLVPGTDAGQSWSETVLARFPSRPAGGGLFPVGDLVADGNGDYFGVTEMGGAGGVGTVFEVRP